MDSKGYWGFTGNDEKDNEREREITSKYEGKIEGLNQFLAELRKRKKDENQKKYDSETLPIPIIRVDSAKGGKRRTRRKRSSKKKYSFPKKTHKTRHRKRRNSV